MTLIISENHFGLSIQIILNRKSIKISDYSAPKISKLNNKHEKERTGVHLEIGFCMAEDWNHLEI
jgi:hypothetical protein